MKVISGITAVSSGSAAFAAWLLAIWSDQQTEWMLTAVLLTALTIATTFWASE